MKKNNKLIKRTALLRVFKENGINRVNKEALEALEENILKEVIKTSKRLHQLLIIKGKKTLKKEDIISKKDMNYPEI